MKSLAMAITDHFGDSVGDKDFERPQRGGQVVIIALILKINQPEVYKQLLTMLSTSVASEIAGIEYDPPPAEDETTSFIYLKKLMEERRGVTL